MRFLKGLSVASTLFIPVTSSPVNLQPRAGNFIVYQTTPKPFKKSGAAAILHTYGKYNASAPADVIRAAAANDGTVPADPTLYDTEYLSPVTVGGQTLNLNFDTGSSDLLVILFPQPLETFWVFSSNLPTALSNGHSTYNPTLSSTARRMDGYTFSISYGDGSGASGDVGTDTVKIGTTTVVNQAVELANEISSQFATDIEDDGLVGLGFDSINTVQPVKQKTFFSNAKASLSAPLFTANLQKGRPGCYTFGYVDANEHIDSITYVPANSDDGHWEFRSNGYAIGTAGFQSYPFSVIADTGSSLNYLPDRIVRAYYRSIPGAGYNYAEGGYTYPCSTVLPNFTIGIGTYKAVIPGWYITYNRVGDDLCFGGIQSNGNLGFSLLGGIFMKSQFVVFQAEPLQLGFAPKVLLPGL
ncbi:MAG: hypothetical protein Q9168_004510 [Polycauliona sp. 1 TL-2023]